MLNPFVQTTNDSFRMLSEQMTQIGDANAIPRAQPQNMNPAQNATTLGGILNNNKQGKVLEE